MSTAIYQINDFTDPAAMKAFTDATKACGDPISLPELLDVKNHADRKREASLARGPMFEAACAYLAMAQAERTVDNVDPEHFYHFAANSFRELGLHQRAGECYFNAAVLGQRALGESKLVDNENYATRSAFAIRSACRAKSLFAEIGDDKRSDGAHVLQHDIRQLALWRERNYVFATVFRVWKFVSDFGTSPTRWTYSVLFTIAAFSIVYPTLIHYGYAEPANRFEKNGVALVMSSVYFSVGNLLQFGTLGTLTPTAPLAQFFAVAHAVFAFVLVGTGVTFLTKR